MKKTFTILIAAIAAILMMAQPGKVMGQSADYTYTLANEDFTTSTHQHTSGSLTWTLSDISGTESYGWDDNYGFKFGSGKKSYPTAFKLTSSSISNKIKKVVATASVNSGKSCKLDVKVGSTTYGSQATINTKNNDTWKFAIADASTVNGAVELSFSSNTGPLYLKKIEIYYYSDGGSAAATTTTINATGITNTDVYTSTAAGSLLASVTSGGNAVQGATVTWSGNNDAVATINPSTGAVTLVSAGTVKFTASYAGVANQYQASSADYNMTVTSSAPSYTVTYNANGGTGTVTDPNSPYNGGANVTVLNNQFRKTDCGFVKWNTQSDGLGTDYLPGATISSINANVDLYAQWEGLTYNFSTHSDYLDWSNSYTSHTLEYSDAYVVFASANKPNSGQAIEDQPVTKGRDVELKLKNGATMSKVTFFCTQWGTKAQTITLHYSTNEGTSYSTFNPTVTSSCFTISKDNLPEGTNAVKITFSSSDNQVGILGATITKIASTNPTLAANDVDLEYDDEDGSISYTLTNPKDGGAVTAAITAGNTGNWLSIGNPSNSNASGTVALTCGVNPGAQRTATVTLKYTYNSNVTIEEEVTVTQAVNPNYVPSISEVRAQGTGSVHTRGVVTSVNGKTAYIQDSGAAIAVYDSSADLEVSVGDQIDVTGTLGTYNGLLQIQSPTISVLSNGNTVEPEVMTIAQVNASTKQGWLVKIEGATVSAINNQNVTITQNSNSVVVHFNSTGDITFEQTDVITLTGNIGYFNTVQIANPTDITVQQVPAISVNPTSLTGFTYVVDNGPSTTKTVSVSGANLTANITLSLGDNSDFEMSTTEGSGYTNSLTLTQSEGSVAATTVYVRLKSGLTVGNSYSGTISLTSTGASDASVSLSGSVTEPVVDYADLPFVWDEKATSTTGLTSSHVSTNNTSPYLKLNDNNNNLDGCVILKLNEAPGVIAFDIKGNPGSGTYSSGTFTVAISADGENYTTIATYTTIVNKVQTMYFTNLNADIRYIKWSYNKGNGNVALGNFNIRSAAEQSTTWTAGEFTPVNNQIYVVNDGATLILDGDYSGTLTNANNLIIEDGGKLITHYAVAATVKKNITGYGEETSDKWNFIASPITPKILIENVTNLLGEQIGDDPVTYNYDLYRLGGRIEDSDHQDWENYHHHYNDTDNPFESLVNGQGYLYAKKANTTLSFAGTVKPYDADLNIPVTEGWNLIGNPYTFDAYANVAYYAMNAEGTGITANTVTTSTAVKPCTGIIIKAAGDGNVKFLDEAPVGSANNSNLQITLAHNVTSRDGASVNSTLDNAIVSFNEGTKLQKFYFGEPAANIYIPQNGEDYAIAFSNRQGDMPLNFKTTEAGMYTISFEGDNMDLKGVSLIDMLAEEKIDLSVDPSYTFIGSPADKAERFKIVFRSFFDGASDDIFAFQSGSDIIVSGEGELQIFDVMGRRVMTQYVSGVQTVNVNAQGVYIMKLNEKTQKIIVR